MLLVKAMKKRNRERKPEDNFAKKTNSFQRIKFFLKSAMMQNAMLCLLEVSGALAEQQSIPREFIKSVTLGTLVSRRSLQISLLIVLFYCVTCIHLKFASFKIPVCLVLQ